MTACMATVLKGPGNSLSWCFLIGAILSQVLLLAQLCEHSNRWQFGHTCCVSTIDSLVPRLLSLAVWKEMYVTILVNEDEHLRLVGENFSQVLRSSNFWSLYSQPPFAFSSWSNLVASVSYISYKHLSTIKLRTCTSWSSCWSSLRWPRSQAYPRFFVL